jgi:transcriptional regulator with XRE-family HTH domain
MREVKAARALLGWTQEELAAQANVSIATIKRLEAKGGHLRGRRETVEKIQNALKKAGVTFVDDDAVGAGVTFKRPLARKRK